MDVDGTRLHYVDRGSGPVIVLLHGNALRLEDFVAAGMIDRLAKHHRVIAFDRPGFGHSDRPRMQLWTPDAQAELLQKALKRLGVSSAVIVGHSWGTLVAIALTLREQTAVRRLVLISGYYFPDARLDVLLAAPAAIPGIGEVLRYTVSAIFARADIRTGY
jgi:pimeloyl-ACP methyl ester carboxylesterase